MPFIGENIGAAKVIIGIMLGLLVGTLMKNFFNNREREDMGTLAFVGCLIGGTVFGYYDGDVILRFLHLYN